jgi:glycosyltransferase involved in cell wall biosynthesis
LVLPLADLDAEARNFASQRFDGAHVDVLDRSILRRSPTTALATLFDAAYDDFLLYAADLRLERLGWLKSVMLLSRARRKWLADKQGRLEAFHAVRYLAEQAPSELGHLAATITAGVLAAPVFGALGTYCLLERRLRFRRLPAAPPGAQPRAAYLRTQFWFRLQGGGSVAHASGVISGLEKSGAGVLVVSSDALAEVQAQTHVVRPSVRYDGALRELEETLYNAPFLRCALPALKAYRPTFLYQRFAALSVAGLLLSRVLRIPHVLEFNSSDAWKARYWGESRLLPLIALGEWANLAGADLIVVVSDALRDDLIRRGIAANRILVNPNAVDPEAFHPALSGDSVRARYGLADKLVVGFSSTLGVWHGVPTLAAVLPLVTAADPRIHFLLVGDGPLRPILEDAVAQHGLQGRVSLVGMVPHHQMPEHLAACDVLLAPHGQQADGREFFGSPTKLFEYMAMGKAIVASRAGQIGRVLEHERNGLLIEPDSAQDLADGILRLAADASLRARLGQAARRDAETLHTWQANAKRLLRRVEALVGR